MAGLASSAPNLKQSGFVAGNLSSTGWYAGVQHKNLMWFFLSNSAIIVLPDFFGPYVLIPVVVTRIKFTAQLMQLFSSVVMRKKILCACADAFFPIFTDTTWVVDSPVQAGPAEGAVVPRFVR